MNKLKLQIVIGSTRDGRNADHIVEWIVPIARETFEVEVLDLRDWKLPMFQETLATLGDLMNPTYTEPVVTKWNQKIHEAEAFVMITPEYNHSVPAVLKNAIDSVVYSFAFRNKPVAFVGYSTGIAAGVRAVEHLNQIMLEAEAIPVRTQVLFPMIHSAFDAEGKPSPAIEKSARVAFEDLAWLGHTLKAGRATQPIPSRFRLRRP
ncbi:putative reductase [Minicystis rosea]|nr:putative reductase [Minicystis rosea]